MCVNVTAFKRIKFDQCSLRADIWGLMLIFNPFAFEGNNFFLLSGKVINIINGAFLFLSPVEFSI